MPARADPTGRILLSLGFILLPFTAVVIWSLAGIYTPTGDEPHYLLIAKRLTTAFTVTIPADSFPEHYVRTGFGVFSPHSIGLPLLIALPFKLAGLPGARLVMMLIGAAIPAVAWAYAGRLGLRGRSGFAAVAATCCALPFWAGATQIYPDLPAGLLCLVGLLAVLEIRARGDHWRLMWTLAAFLPWLHIKNVLPLGFLTIAALSVSSTWRERLALAAIPAATVLGVMAYNLIAYANPFGPYQAEAQHYGWVALMIFTGLFLDQNQGMFFQNPLLMIGLFYFPNLWRHDRFLAALIAILLLAVLVPNAGHTNIYGGASFSGRFQWTASCLMLVPTLYGLARIRHDHSRLFWALIAMQAALQSVFFVECLWPDRSLYNRLVPIRDYSILFGRAGEMMPAFYDIGLAWVHLPNHLASVLLAISMAIAVRSSWCRSLADVGSPQLPPQR